MNLVYVVNNYLNHYLSKHEKIPQWPQPGMIRVAAIDILVGETGEAGGVGSRGGEEVLEEDGLGGGLDGLLLPDG